MNLKLVLVATLLHAGFAFPFINGGVDRQNIPGVLGNDDPSDEPPDEPPELQTADYYTYGYSYYSHADPETSAISGNNGLGGLFTTSSTSSTSSSTKTSTSHSIATAVPTSATQPTSTISNTTSLTLPTSAAGNKLAASGVGDSKTWKVVGVAVIVVIAVMVVILVVVFFDRWTQFLRDVLLGRKRSDGAEYFVPDWEKRSWEVKLAEDDNNQIPSDPPSALDIAVPVKPPVLANESVINRHPFPLRPGAKPAFNSFVSPDAQESKPAENRSYSSMTTAELQRQNSRAAQHAYTAYA